MAYQPLFEVKDPEGDEKIDICMDSVKRALDDVEESVNEEPKAKRPRHHSSRPSRIIKSSTTILKKYCQGRKKKVFSKKYTQDKQHNAKSKLRYRWNPSEAAGGQQKKKQATAIRNGKKVSKRSADSTMCHLANDVSSKKPKLEDSIEEPNENKDLIKTEDEKEKTENISVENSKDEGSGTEPQTESTKSDQETAEVAQEDKDYAFLPQNYCPRNVAFARRIMVYSSDGSEYDYDHSDDGGVDSSEVVVESCSRDSDDGDLYDDYKDPNLEEVKKKLNSQISKYMKKHRNGGDDSSDDSDSQDSMDNKVSYTVHEVRPSTSGTCFFPRFRMLSAINIPPDPENDETYMDEDINGNKKEETDGSKHLVA